MAKEEEKKEKVGEEKKKTEEKKKKEEEKEKEAVKSAVYRVSLHCPKCAHDITKPLLTTPGVQNVDVKFEKNEITVKGIIDEKKIHQRIEKLSRRNVEILPPPAPPEPKKTTEKEKVAKETKVTATKTTIKVFFHCRQCERDLRTKLLNKKGIHNVKTDMKAQTIDIEGTVESKKLLAYMKRVHKHAEIVPPKEEKKEKEKEKEKEIVPPKEEKKKEKEKEKEIVPPREEKKKEKGKEEKEKEKEKEIAPPKEEKKKENEKEKEKEKAGTETEAKTGNGIVPYGDGNVPYFIHHVYPYGNVPYFIGNVPYFIHHVYPYGNVPNFIHYVYAPQMFSDENPNACSIM